jgi:hypothetical protein
MATTIECDTPKCGTIIAGDFVPTPPITDDRVYPDEWDVTTGMVDGVEMTVERHIGVFCEACGTQTVVSVPLLDKPEPFRGH